MRVGYLSQRMDGGWPENGLKLNDEGENSERKTKIVESNRYVPGQGYRPWVGYVMVYDLAGCQVGHADHEIP
ncbi:uncharacterized protein G2W53_007872 [Senna tora]|uniref:Uncharacterized protein n=1 Tax=Senna tora TaxID=362788 RepID=A0A834X7H2_9FABA|nr:uncharacterized protein G2W53_007872 [Senna tora]